MSFDLVFAILGGWLILSILVTLMYATVRYVYRWRYARRAERAHLDALKREQRQLLDQIRKTLEKREL